VGDTIELTGSGLQIADVERVAVDGAEVRLGSEAVRKIGPPAT
jgi:histidine ammonia-lyase